LPTPGAGNSFVYKVSADSNPVATPDVGEDLSSWTAVTNGATITAADGKNIGVAEVNSSNEAVKFVNDTAVTQDYVAATSGTAVGSVSFATDSDVDTATTNENSNTLTFTIDGATSAVSYTVDGAVSSKSGLVSALNTKLGSAATVSWNASNQLVVTSASTGSTSSVVVGGTAETTFFGTTNETSGEDAKN